MTRKRPARVRCNHSCILPTGRRGQRAASATATQRLPRLWSWRSRFSLSLDWTPSLVGHPMAALHVPRDPTCSHLPIGMTGCRRRDIVPPCSVASRCFAPLRPFGRLSATWTRPARGSGIALVAGSPHISTTSKSETSRCGLAVGCLTVGAVQGRSRCCAQNSARRAESPKCARDLLSHASRSFDRPRNSSSHDKERT